jgi:hypothetical protein
LPIQEISDEKSDEHISVKLRLRKNGPKFVHLNVGNNEVIISLILFDVFLVQLTTGCDKTPVTNIKI